MSKWKMVLALLGILLFCYGMYLPGLYPGFWYCGFAGLLLGFSIPVPK